VIVLRRLLNALADLHEGVQDLSSFKDYLESIPAAAYSRFYYENILRRSPESSAASLEKVNDRLGFALQFVSSDEFARKHISFYRMCFPEKAASIFIHVPKTGGNTVIGAQKLSRRYCFLHMPAVICEERLDQRKSYYGRTYSELRNSTLDLAFLGHPTGRFIYESNLRQSSDVMFATFRDPLQAVTSYINYIFTVLALADASADEGFLRRDDVLKFRSVVGSTREISEGKVTDDILDAILRNLIPPNMQCGAIGFEPTFSSALDAIDILGIELIPTDHLASFIRRQGWPDVPPLNVSTKFVTRETLSRYVLSTIYEYIGEDLKLVSWATKRAE